MVKGGTASRSLIVVALASAAVAPGCDLGGDSDKAGGQQRTNAVVLTLADHDNGLDLEEFARELERRSEGSVRIELELGWREQQIDYEPRTIEDVREGKVDLAKISARAFDVVGVKSLQPVVAPFAVDSYALQREVLHADVAADMLAGVDRLDLVGVALLPGDMRKPVGLTRALLDPRDYWGATIATRLSRLGLRTFRALGATGKPHLPDADVSSFDGLESGLTGLDVLSVGPRATLAANVNLWPRTLAIVMNRDSYERLSEDQRRALRAAGRAAIDPALERIRRRDRESLGILCRSGKLTVGAATSSQLRGLRAATRAASNSLERDRVTRRAARVIAALREEVEAEPAPSCDRAADSRPRARSTPVDGLWRMDSTERQFARIAPPSDVHPENWGEFIFAFRDGRFAFTTENGKACVWAYGSHAVKGDIVEWTIEDGGGIAATEDDFFNRPGEFFTYRWSRYRDRLTLAPVAGAISPEPFRVNPWRLLEGRPVRSGLAKRCLPPSDALEP